jgi:hypothetical protein
VGLRTLPGSSIEIESGNAFKADFFSTLPESREAGSGEQFSLRFFLRHDDLLSGRTTGVVRRWEVPELLLEEPQEGFADPDRRGRVFGRRRAEFVHAEPHHRQNQERCHRQALGRNGSRLSPQHYMPVSLEIFSPFYRIRSRYSAA